MRRAIATALALATPMVAQGWAEVCGRAPAGVVELRQAARDAAADALVLLVASHPDDRYLLPAVWLRGLHGVRVEVLLATRGGGGQNSIGPETGDALERIRTLETEVGGALAGASIWYLNLPDGGYRRSAAETFAEWGREGSLRDLVRMLRLIRPDAVLTTHHAEESHGHDQALVELLAEAVHLAAEPTYSSPHPPHPIRLCVFGAGNAIGPDIAVVDADQLDLDRGVTLRRRAHDILRLAHISPGPPAPLEVVFEPTLRLRPLTPEAIAVTGPRVLGLPSLLDDDVWPWSREIAARLRHFLERELPGVLHDQPPLSRIAAAITELRALAATPPAADDGIRRRLERRIEALQRLLLIASGLQIEVDVEPGTAAVAGEEFSCRVRVLGNLPPGFALRAAGVGDLRVALEPVDPGLVSGHLLLATIMVPLSESAAADPMLSRFRAERFEPPVRLRFFVSLHGVEIPVDITLPVEQHAAAKVYVVPRMLLLPSGRTSLQFSVGVTRNSRFPIERELVVRAPAGYAVGNDRRQVDLRDRRSDLFGFVVTAPEDRRPGIDMLRIRMGTAAVALPVHKVEVQVRPILRIGVLRIRDDTLPSVLGAGGLGLDWSELTDADLAAADLGAFDTIVVDVRALRDRPGARRGFRRLLDFATGRGRRLVLFYQKDLEFHPAGEEFVGAPLLPFQVGRRRVTRPDAPVRVLLPGHPLLCYPNLIGPSDWDGWEQERALYIPSVYGPEYEEILEIADPGQPPERGALLYFRTGDGEYVYCALALWRQLKKLHPGAVRLLANLLTPSTSR